MADKTDKDTKTIRTDRLIVRGKTLVFDNSIYQIPNISAIEVGTVERPLSQIFLVALLVGFGLLFVYPLVGVVLLIVVGIIYYNWYQKPEYGLIIRLNSGLIRLFTSKDKEFLKEVAVVLRNIMDSEEERAVTFNLDQRQIIDNVSGSTVVLGDAKGDIVNRV